MTELRPRLRPKQVAFEYGIPVSTLSMWRNDPKGNQGPKFMKLGPAPQSPIVYDRRDLDAWFEERGVENSTAPAVNECR